MASQRDPTAWTTWALTAAVSGLYAWTAPRGVLAGDNPEFSALFGASGVAHPSGYPLYVLWLRAWSWLPVSTPAHGASLVTALLGTATVPIMVAAARAWGAPRPAANLAAGAYAVSPLAWSLSVQAEVFALLVLASTAIVAMAAPADEGLLARSPRVRTALLGLAAGLAVSNHLSCVLLVPIGAFGVLDALRASRSKGVDLGAALGAFALGLLPYVSIPVAARSHAWPWVWGEPRTFAGVLRHVLRADYGSGSLSAGAGDARPLEHLHWLAVDVLRQTAFVGVGFALLGLVALAHPGTTPVTDLARRRRAGAWALAATFVLAGPLFVSRFNLKATGITAPVVARFHLLPVAVLVPFVAVGVGVAGTWLAQRWSAAATSVRVPSAVGLVVPAVLAAIGWAPVRDALRTDVDDYLHNLFGSLPPRAIVVGGSDHVFGGALYVQRAERLRQDVDVVSVSALNAPWYRAVVARLWKQPVELRIEEGGVDPDSLVDALLLLDRPVFAIESRSAKRATFGRHRTYRHGPLVRVLPDSAAAPDALALERLNADTFAGFRVAPDVPSGGDSWSRRIYEDYGLAWLDVARRYEAAGESERARANFARAIAFAPWLGPK